MCPVPCIWNQAATKDLLTFFGSFGVSWIEWLNGVSLNVHFEDVYSAERALHLLSLPIPVVDGGCLLAAYGVFAICPRLIHWLLLPLHCRRQACEPHVAHRGEALGEGTDGQVCPQR